MSIPGQKGGSLPGVKHPGYPEHRYEPEKQERMEEKKVEFLKVYGETFSFKKAIEAVGCSSYAPYWWVYTDDSFKEEFYRLRAVRDSIRQENLEQFLYDCGTGSQKTGKDYGLSMANVVAAKMSLVAVDPKRWSEKLYTEKKEVQTITTVVIHAGEKEQRDVIDSPEVKVLESGR